MLAKMYLTNFLSFKERTEIDLTASKYSILGKTNVYKSEILKGALFIGPNASGKSNALKGLSFIIKMIKGEASDEEIDELEFPSLETSKRGDGPCNQPSLEDARS